MTSTTLIGFATPRTLESFRTKLVNSERMVSLGLPSVTASALSLWLGLLACLFGCAKPVVAASTERRQSLEAGMGVCPERDSEAGDSCCRHGHDSPRNSDKSSHHAKSCCPTETALTQKNSLTAPPLLYPHVTPLALPNFDVSGFGSARESIERPTLSHAGRDILRQVHVLRL
jgi:hypothetical protein